MIEAMLMGKKEETIGRVVAVNTRPNLITFHIKDDELHEVGTYTADHYSGGVSISPSGSFLAYGYGRSGSTSYVRILNLGSKGEIESSYRTIYMSGSERASFTGVNFSGDEEQLSMSLLTGQSDIASFFVYELSGAQVFKDTVRRAGSAPFHPSSKYVYVPNDGYSNIRRYSYDGDGYSYEGATSRSYHVSSGIAKVSRNGMYLVGANYGYINAWTINQDTYVPGYRRTLRSSSSSDGSRNVAVTSNGEYVAYGSSMIYIHTKSSETLWGEGESIPLGVSGQSVMDLEFSSDSEYLVAHTTDSNSSEMLILFKKGEGGSTYGYVDSKTVSGERGYTNNEHQSVSIN